MRQNKSVSVTTLQLYVDRARLDDIQPGGFDLLKGLIDVGDIVGASGTLKRTEKGELSVLATGIQVCFQI
jgi:lysyl-tRNA synthetase class 2